MDTIVSYPYVCVVIKYSQFSCFIVCGPADVAFVLDSSGSIGKKNWPKVLDFSKSVTQNLMHATTGGKCMTTCVDECDYDNIPLSQM